MREEGEGKERAGITMGFGLSQSNFLVTSLSLLKLTRKTHVLLSRHVHTQFVPEKRPINLFLLYFDIIWNEIVPLQLAQCRFPLLAISNAKILMYFSNRIYGSNFIRQHSETDMV